VLIVGGIAAAIVIGTGDGDDEATTSSTSAAQSALEEKQTQAVLTLNNLQDTNPGEYETLCSSLETDGYAKTFDRLENTRSLAAADAGALIDELQQRCESGKTAANDLVPARSESPCIGRWRSCLSLG
jgi:hypothetical protein